MRQLPAFELRAFPLDDAAKASAGFKWAEAPIGKRHKLGGTPDFVRENDTPNCSCGKLMTFYAQLDSIDDEFCMADCGMIYVFICFDCFETKSVFQTM
jgi:uncharacterized protein YwqG